MTKALANKGWSLNMRWIFQLAQPELSWLGYRSMQNMAGSCGNMYPGKKIHIRDFQDWFGLRGLSFRARHSSWRSSLDADKLKVSRSYKGQKFTRRLEILDRGTTRSTYWERYPTCSSCFVIVRLSFSGLSTRSLRWSNLPIFKPGSSNSGKR